MRITIDIRLLARGGTTGIPGYTRDLVDTLIAKHPEHEYQLFYNALRRQQLPRDWYLAKHAAIVTGHIPNRLLNLSFGFLNRPQPAVLQKTEVILSPNLDILPQTQAPRVITFHDLSFIHYPEFFSPKDHAWHRLQHYAKQAQAATRIIAVSEFTKQDLINILKLPAEKIDVVYSGINRSFRQISPHSPELTNYQRAHQLTRPFILYLGSLEPRKNLPLLIKAFTELKKQRQFNDYELVFAGRPGYRANEIIALAHQSPVSKDIRFLGSVADEDRVFLYNLARVFVFPSWFEGFGFPPLEAQACGTPVIASNRSSLPEILGESALLVDPWKVHELAKAISSIESDSKMRDTIITAGLQNANRFSWDTTTAQTLAVCKRAIA